MSRALGYTETAEANLADISVYIANESGLRSAGQEFSDQLRAKCRRLASLPGTLGTARPDLGDDLRSTPHKGYVIFFRYTPDALEIINILSASRDLISYFTTDE